MAVSLYRAQEGEEPTAARLARMWQGLNGFWTSILSLCTYESNSFNQGIKMNALAELLPLLAGLMFIYERGGFLPQTVLEQALEMALSPHSRS